MGQRGPKPGTRPSGRTKGTPNKRTVALQQALAQAGFSAPEQIATMFKDPQIPVALKIELCLHLLPYLYPRLRPVDPPGSLAPEHVAEMLGQQVRKFRDALQQHVHDPGTITLILEALRV